MEVFSTELVQDFSNPVLVQDRRRWMSGAKEPEMRSWRMTDRRTQQWIEGLHHSHALVNFDLGFVIKFFTKTFRQLSKWTCAFPHGGSAKNVGGIFLGISVGHLSPPLFARTLAIIDEQPRGTWRIGRGEGWGAIQICCQMVSVRLPPFWPKEYDLDLKRFA